MAKWVFTRAGTWDYPTLGFTATTDDIIEADLAPDAWWDETDSGATPTIPVVPSGGVEEPASSSLLVYNAVTNRGEWTPLTDLGLDEASLSSTFGALPDAYADPRQMAAGAVTGMTRGTFVTSFGNSPYVVSGGALTHVPSQGANTAAYLQAMLSGTVTRIGCLAEWSDTATGTVALVIPSTIWATGALTDAGVHVTVTAAGKASHSRFESSAEANKQSVELGSLTGGRHLIETVLDPRLETITLLVDGQRVLHITDAAAFDLLSAYAVWELYEANGTSGVPAEILACWASTESRIPPSEPVLTATRANLPAPSYANYNSAQTWNIGTSYAKIDAALDLSILVPPSGKVLTSLACYVSGGTAAVYARPIIGGTAGTPIRVADSGFAGMVSLQQVALGTAGTTQTLSWQMSCASGSPTVKAGGSSGGATVTAVPLPD